LLFILSILSSSSSSSSSSTSSLGPFNQFHSSIRRDDLSSVTSGVIFHFIAQKLQLFPPWSFLVLKISVKIYFSVISRHFDLHLTYLKGNKYHRNTLNMKAFSMLISALKGLKIVTINSNKLYN
jgi:hypothetical protein